MVDNRQKQWTSADASDIARISKGKNSHQIYHVEAWKNRCGNLC